MAQILSGKSLTFNDLLLLPNLTKKSHVSPNISLETVLTKHKLNERADALKIQTPIVSAAMQAVSDDNLAIALARTGGVSFIYCSQSIEAQAQMIKKVKNYKAGFVESRSNLSPEATLETAQELQERIGHGKIAITEDGTAHGKFLGILMMRHVNPEFCDLSEKVSKYMTPREKLLVTDEDVTLKEANRQMWQEKADLICVTSKSGNLKFLVFRKDYESHKECPLESVDGEKRLLVGAAVNTHDYQDRIPALVEAGADLLSIDSSDGYSEWQRDVLQFVRERYGDKVKIGAGNVVDGDAFRYLVENGADFVKIGIGGGSICITREQKAIGRGQGSSVIDVAKARDDYFKETGVDVPICSDGGAERDRHITLALALGADFVMLGRFFSRFEEGPTAKTTIDGRVVKEYWGEGSNRAQNWKRYNEGGGKNSLVFEEGIDGYVPFAGKLEDGVGEAVVKIKSTMSNCGAMNLREFTDGAKITIISPLVQIEGGVHGVTMREKSNS